MLNLVLKQAGESEPGFARKTVNGPSHAPATGGSPGWCRWVKGKAERSTAARIYHNLNWSAAASLERISWRNDWTRWRYI